MVSSTEVIKQCQDYLLQPLFKSIGVTREELLRRFYNKRLGDTREELLRPFFNITEASFACVDYRDLFTKVGSQLPLAGL